MTTETVEQNDVDSSAVSGNISDAQLLGVRMTALDRAFQSLSNEAQSIPSTVKATDIVRAAKHFERYLTRGLDVVKTDPRSGN